jgi:hypothetical protein
VLEFLSKGNSLPHPSINQARPYSASEIKQDRACKNGKIKLKKEKQSEQSGILLFKIISQYI